MIPPAPTAALTCDEPCLPGSSYCPAHHTLCHFRHGSKAEAKKIRDIDRYARATIWTPGGRVPTEEEFKQLDRLA
jgi:hypothetical protein